MPTIIGCIACEQNCEICVEKKSTFDMTQYIKIFMPNFTDYERNYYQKIYDISSKCLKC